MKIFDTVFRLIIILFLAALLYFAKNLSENGKYQRFNDYTVIDTRTGQLYRYMRNEIGKDKWEYKLFVKGLE